MFGSRQQDSLREIVRAQREEHASTRTLILRYHEEVRREREEIEREGNERTAQMRREGKERAEQMRREGEARTAEMREFNREILLRNEKVYTAAIAELEEGRRQLAENTGQVEANTKAVLAMLDRLNGSGPAD